MNEHKFDVYISIESEPQIRINNENALFVLQWIGFYANVVIKFVFIHKLSVLYVNIHLLRNGSVTYEGVVVLTWSN